MYTLKKLTLKSKLDLPQYPKLTIQEIIDLGNIEYLVYVYYSTPCITFFQEVLDLISIKKEDEIIKPGKITYKEFKEIIRKRRKEGICNPERFKSELVRLSENSKFMRENELDGFLFGDKMKYSPSRLAWKNQGHTKEN